LEQAMIGEAPAETRLRVFGRYNAIAYLAGAVGALAAGGPAAFRHLFPALPANQRFLLAFPVVAAGCVLLARKLSPSMEGASGLQRGGSGVSARQRQRTEGAERPPRRDPGAGPAAGLRRRRPRNQQTIRRLAALFALDSFGGGFI